MIAAEFLDGARALPDTEKARLERTFGISGQAVLNSHLRMARVEFAGGRFELHEHGKRTLIVS